MIGRLQAQSGRGALLALGEAGPAPEPLRHVNGAVRVNGSAANGHAATRAPALALVVPDDARVADRARDPQPQGPRRRPGGRDRAS